ncbi:MAG: amidohydrolase family protein [Acidobacteria bacterium]|nr:amidohydrolase family protein [Acidobacteriota bacterium]
MVCAMPTTKTLQIRNARLYDGDGVQPVSADLVVSGSRVAAVLPAGSPVATDATLDADGLCAAPGFVDIHSHSDGALAHPAAAELLEPFLLQGITTQIIGNCGLGVAPAPRHRRADLAAFMALIIPPGMDFIWETFDEYMETLERNPLPLNVAALAPHGSLRCAVSGTEPGPAKEANLDAMAQELRAALAAGAFGLSAGLIYPPGMWADTDELVVLCDEVAAVDGVFGCHVRGSSELALDAERELLEIGTRTGVRLQHSHHEAFGPGYWHLAHETLRMEDEARAQGIDIASDVVPYHAVNTTLLAVFPPWSLAGGVGELCNRLADPAQLARIDDEIHNRVPTWPPWHDGWAHNLVRAGGWDNIVPLHARSESHGGWLGRSLTDTAAAESKSPLACAVELIAASEGDVMARYHGISGAPGDEGTLRELLVHEHHSIGVDVILKGEGVAHPGGFGAMPRVLGHYAREAGWLDLGKAIRKITSMPAARIGVPRGRLGAGTAADIVLFDPDTVDERGTYSRPDRRPGGIEHVFINGTHVVDRGQLLRRDAGQLLRRGA